MCLGVERGSLRFWDGRYKLSDGDALSTVGSLYELSWRYEPVSLSAVVDVVMLGAMIYDEARYSKEGTPNLPCNV